MSDSIVLLYRCSAVRFRMFRCVHSVIIRYVSTRLLLLAFYVSVVSFVVYLVMHSNRYVSLHSCELAWYLLCFVDAVDDVFLVCAALIAVKAASITANMSVLCFFFSFVEVR